MGPTKKKRDHLSLVIVDEQDQYGYDARLARRWKRKCVANRNFKVNSNGKNSKNKCNKTLKHSPGIDYIQIDEEGQTLDIEYKEYLSKYIKAQKETLISDDDNGRGESADIDNKKCLDEIGLGLHDSVYMDNDKVDVNVVNGSVANDTGGDGAVNDKHVDAKPLVCHNMATRTVNGFAENAIGGNEALKDGNADARSVDFGNVGTRTADDSTVHVSKDDGIVSPGTIDDGNGDARCVDDGNVDAAFSEKVNVFDSSVNDDIVVAGNADNVNENARSLHDGIVGDKVVDDGNNVDARFVGKRNCGDDDNNDASDDMDPDYMMFLEKVREDGQSYVLEIPMSDDVSVIYKYEAVEHGCNVENPETMRDFAKRKSIKTEKVLKSGSTKERMETHIDSSGERMETQRMLRNVAGGEGNNSVVERRVRKGAVDLISCRANGFEKVLMSGSTRERMETQNDSSRERIKSQRILRDVASKEGISSVVEKRVRKGAVDLISCRANGHASKRPSGLSKHDCEHEMQKDAVDQSYQMFLNSLKIDGKRVVFMHTNSKEMIYYEDPQSSSDSEVIEMTIDPFSNGNHTPFVTSKEYLLVNDDGRWCTKGSGRNYCSQFREGLLAILKKPFDKKELDYLSKEVSRRRVVERDRELRGGRTKRYPTESQSKSYLDQYTDLMGKINAANSNEPKVLNLLRGFFYFLQNVAHPEAFKPWLDPSCLKVLPHQNEQMHF